MNNNPTSLDRLHDIVAPPPVPWWPPAPGWYVVLGAAAIWLAWRGIRAWRHWRANAYRRAALRELDAAATPSAISEVLRRTALAVAPRSTIAALSGEQWPCWLADKLPEPMPEPVQDLLTAGVYQPWSDNTDIRLLRTYAKQWIQRHRLDGLSAQQDTRR